MYFHTDDNGTISRLAEALNKASAHGQRIRLDTDADGNLKYKIGEGMWTAPISSTEDPYRG